MQLLFRADGNSTIGLGHLVRSLALAEMLQPHYTCYFAIQDPSEAVLQQIQASGCVVIKLPATTDYLTEAKNLTQAYGNQFSAVILDGYQFLTGYQETLRPFLKIICIDDLHAIHFVADAIINPAGGVSASDYSKENYTKFYAGPAYALLRAPFLQAATGNRSFPEEPRIFINLGGADPENYTARIITQLLALPEKTRLEVVVGSAYRHLNSLQELMRQNPDTVNLHQQLNASEMCQLMQSCTLAVVPPSTVAYEWCSVGGPLFLIRTAENQKNLEKFLLQNDLALPYSKLNSFLPPILTNPAYFSGQINKQRSYFDGQSPARLRQVVDQLFYPDLLQFRPVQANDLQLLFLWINDPVVRRFSLNPEPVPFTTHATWFNYKLTDKNCFIFIAEIRHEPVGMIRFDIDQNEAVISYLIDENFRGRGLGTLVLQLGIEKFKKMGPKVTHISGLVQKENLASVKAFIKAGFKKKTAVNKDYPNVLKFTLLTEK